MPCSSQLAETIASNFYNNAFDLSHRGLTADATWSLMPEVEAVKQLRDLHASESAIRVFLTSCISHGSFARLNKALQGQCRTLRTVSGGFQSE